MSGQGGHRHGGNKGRRGVAERVVERGAEAGPEPGARQIQGRITAVQGLASPHARPHNPVSQQSPFRKSFISL